MHIHSSNFTFPFLNLFQMVSTSLRLALLASVASTSLAAPTLNSRQDSSLDPYPQQDLVTFGDDGKFEIMVVTDTHLIDNADDPATGAAYYNQKSADAVTTYIQQKKPNYAVHLGDLVSGEVAKDANEVSAAVKQILTPIVNAGIPFSTTKGNHDNDIYSTHESITGYEKELSSSLSYTRNGGNFDQYSSDTYWVPVYKDKSAQRGSKPSLLLWFFDSRSGHTLGGQGGVDGWVDPAVGDWIKSEASKMEAAWGDLPSGIAFVHVPSHDFVQAASEDPYQSHVGGVKNETVFETENRTYPGLNDDEPFAGQANDNGYTGADRPYLEAFTTSPTGNARIHAIVSGHQHGNDWCSPSSLKTSKNQIVPVCFAKHSGFGGYDYANWNHGVRTFQFDLSSVDNQVDTNIRFLTGETRYQATLNDDWANQVPA